MTHSLIRKRSLCALAASFSLSGLAHAQSAVATWSCTIEVWPTRTEFGSSVAVLGDLDGDGFDDIAMGLPGGGVTGYPYVSTPPAVWISVPGGTITSSVDADRFGESLCALGDIDGDDVPDFAVGAPARDSSSAPNAGVVVVYSGASLIELYSLQGGLNSDGFGVSIDGGVDVNADGVPDLLIGAPQSQFDLGGYVRVVSGVDGSVLRSHSGFTIGADFGQCVRWLSDIDDDGTRDYAVGAPGETLIAGFFAAGRVRLFSGASGAQIATFDAGADREHLGTVIAALGDIDRDGRDDFAIGATSEPQGPPSYLLICSGATLQVISTYQWGPPAAGVGWGLAVSSAGDWNGDGYADIAIGGRITASIHSGRDGLVLAEHGAECTMTSSRTSLAGPCRFAGTRSDQVVIGIVDDTPDCGGAGSHAAGTVMIMDPSLLKPSDGARDITIQGWGGSLARIGDLNGDGLQDLLIGDGRVVSVLSREALLDVPDGRVSYGGDVDCDGVEDVYSSNGVTSVVYSGANGSVIHSVPGGFTSPNSGGRDLNHDGHADFLTHSDAAGTRVYSGADGSLMFVFPQGRVASFISDVNGDGSDDIAIADPSAINSQGYNLGVAWVRSGATGAQLGQPFDGTGTGLWDNFGYRLNDIGDVDGDGVGDIGAATWGGNSMWTYGELQVFSGATLTLIANYQDANPYQGPAYGYAFASCGDRDGDGVDELAIGNPGAMGPLNYTSSGNGGVSPWDYFGYAVDNLGDVDGDGVDDIAWGAPAERGMARVVVISSACLYDRYHCAPLPNSTGAPALVRASGSGSFAANSLSLSVSGLPAGKPGMFFMGPTAIPTPLGSQRRCVVGSVRRIPTTLVADVHGGVSLALDLTQDPLDLISAGSIWNFQFWYRDPGGPLSSGQNFSDAVEIEFCP